MGFVDYNTLGKFQAEVDTPLPAFAAENLYSLPTKQFGAATIDADNISNYDPTHWSRFHVGDDGSGSGWHTTNVGGGVKTGYDKGFHLTMDSGADVGSQVVNLSRTGEETFSFELKPGDQLKRAGQHKNVIYVPADGSDPVTTEVPWIRGGSYNITLDAVTPLTPAGNGNNGTNGTNGDNGNNGNGGNGGNGETEEETNWMLYGGAFALLAVGGFMAVNMMKKKSKK